MMQQERKNVVCQTLEKEISKNDETQQTSGPVPGKYGVQQSDTQKGRTKQELRRALTLLVQCQLATQDVIQTSETFVADILEEFLETLEKHKVAMAKLEDVYK